MGKRSVVLWLARVAPPLAAFAVRRPPSLPYFAAHLIAAFFYQGAIS